MRHFFLFLCLLMIACDQNPQKNVGSNETNIGVDTVHTEPFNVKDYYSKVFDTTKFLLALENGSHLKPMDTSSRILNKFEKIKLNGSTDEFYFIEDSFPQSANIDFPGKFQFVLNHNGNLLKVLSAIRVDLVKVSPSENPYLFVLGSTPHGNGGHALFRISSDTLEDVYDGFLGNRPQTYTTGYDNEVNIPEELNHEFSDQNKDGFNDLVFWDEVQYSKADSGIENKTVPVKFVFLYNKKNGHFIEKEDYSKKYEFVYGDTK